MPWVYKPIHKARSVSRVREEGGQDGGSGTLLEDGLVDRPIQTVSRTKLRV
jgi:hypothetical protein